MRKIKPCLREIKSLPPKDIAELYVAIQRLNYTSYYEDLLDVVAEEATILSGCERVSLVILNKRNELILKVGVPSGEHRLGKIAETEIASLMRKTLAKGDQDVISDVCRDERTRQMYELARDKNIASLLLTPFFSKKGIPLGILAIDSRTKGKFTEKKATLSQKIKLWAQSSAVAIEREYENKKKALALKKKVERNVHLSSLGQNASEIAHNLRNPLTSLLGFIRRIRKVAERLMKTQCVGWCLKTTCEAIIEYCDESIAEETRMKNVIDEVVRFSSISSQKPKLNFADINNLLKEVKEGFLAQYIKDKKIGAVKVNFDIDRRLSKIFLQIDSDMLKSCFENLLRNAVDAIEEYMVEGGKQIKHEIKLKTRLQEGKDKAIITIANTGKPIEIDIGEMFNPWVTTKGSRGTGLGLAHVKSAIYHHDGEIEAIPKNRSVLEINSDVFAKDTGIPLEIIELAKKHEQACVEEDPSTSRGLCKRIRHLGDQIEDKELKKVFVDFFTTYVIESKYPTKFKVALPIQLKTAGSQK